MNLIHSVFVIVCFSEYMDCTPFYIFGLYIKMYFITLISVSDKLLLHFQGTVEVLFYFVCIDNVWQLEGCVYITDENVYIDIYCNLSVDLWCSDSCEVKDVFSNSGFVSLRQAGVETGAVMYHYSAHMQTL